MNGTDGRSLIRQGFIVLLLAFALGFGIIAGGPHARGWMATHVTAMLTGVFAVLIGLCWDKLTLSARQRRILYVAVVFNGYWGILAGAFATLAGVPGPATGGGAKPEGLAAVIFFTAFIPLLTVLPFVFAGLTIYGLRASPREP